MVDLMNLYEQNGLLIGAAELPDYPAVVPGVPLDAPAAPRRASCWPAGHILSALAERLRNARFALRGGIRALVALAAAKPNGADVVDAAERRPIPMPDDLAALDAAWEEAAVHSVPEPGDGCKDG